MLDGWLTEVTHVQHLLVGIWVVFYYEGFQSWPNLGTKVVTKAHPCHTLPLLQPFTTTTGMYWVIINFLFKATNFLCMCNQQLCFYDPGVFSTLLTVHFGSVLPITSMGGPPGRCPFLFYFPCFEGNSVLGPFLTHTRHAGYLVKCRTSVSTSFH